jgi:hypothetical protein
METVSQLMIVSIINPTLIVLALSGTNYKPEEKIFYFPQDYSQEAQEYMLKHYPKESYNPNDILYKIIAEELLREEK